MGLPFAFVLVLIVKGVTASVLVYMMTGDWAGAARRCRWSDDAGLRRGVLLMSEHMLLSREASFAAFRDGQAEGQRVSRFSSHSLLKASAIVLSSY